MTGFFTAALSRNDPKKSINVAWMFTSGITGLVVNIYNREFMHLSDLDGDPGLQEKRARAVQLCTRLCTLLHVEIFQELLPLTVVCTPTHFCVCCFYSSALPWQVKNRENGTVLKWGPDFVCNEVSWVGV